MSLADKIHNEFIKHGIKMTRVEAGLSNEAAELLQELSNELAAKLAKVNWDSGDVSRKLQRLQALKKQVDKVIASSYGELQGITDLNSRSLALSEAKFMGETYNGLLGVDLLDITLNKDLLETLAGDVMITGSPASAWWEKQSSDLSFNFMKEMRLGISQGETLSDLVRRVRGRRENNFTDGIMSTATRNAEALVRTSAQTVLNDTRMAMYSQNEGLLQGYVWSATLDLRTCVLCRARDGAMYDLEGKPLNGLAKKVDMKIPPIHFNDRCALVGVMKSWEQLAKEAGGDTRLAKRLDKINSGTRASMDGQVPETTTFDKWIKAKDKSDPDGVRDMMGVKRYDLWKRDKFKLSDFLDDRGNAVKVSDL